MVGGRPTSVGLNTAVRSDDVEETVDQRNLVERASRGDKDAFGLLVVASWTGVWLAGAACALIAWPILLRPA